MPDRGIFRLMIAARFKIHPDAAGERLLLDFVEDVSGLRGLVMAILAYETKYAKKAASIRKMCMEVIEEELEKGGIPRDVMLGSR
jgi:hypothetical protein